MQKVMGGAEEHAPARALCDWPWDAGIGSAAGWSGTPASRHTGVNSAINVTLGGGAGPLVFTTPPTQGLSTANSLVQYQLHFNWDTDAPRSPPPAASTGSAAYDFMGTHSTDLSTLKDKGGKMIVYHGSSDPVFSFNYTANWFDSLSPTPANGTVKDFVRLFARAGHEPLLRRPGNRFVPGLHRGRELGREGAGARPVVAAVEHHGAGPLRLDPAGRRDDAGAAAVPVPAVRTLHRRDGHEPAALAAQNDPSNYVCTTL